MATLHTQPATPEPGSFRDPDSRVFYAGDAVYRALSTEGLDDFRALQAGRAARGSADRRHRARARRPRARRAAGQGDGGGAPARADPVRLVSVRVDVLDAQGRRAAPARPAAGRPRARPRPQGLDARTTCSSGARARCSSTSGSFERLRAGRAVGRLPPVLHALPVPAAAAGAEGRALPAVAARLARGHHGDRDARPDVGARPLPPRSADPRLPARTARAPLRGSRRRGQGRAAAGRLSARS